MCWDQCKYLFLLNVLCHFAVTKTRRFTYNIPAQCLSAAALGFGVFHMSAGRL